MGYNGLTNFGIEYQARMTAENKPVTLTKVRVGNGSIPASQTGATTTNLYSYKKEVEILAKEQVENAVKLQILLNNLDQEIGFYVKELGVYVQDGAEEKLYWYINKDNPSYLDNKNVPSKHRYNLFLEVTNVETIIINFTGQGLLADKKYVDDSIADFETGYNITLNDIRNKINSKMVAGTLINSMNTGENIVKALQGNAGLNFDPNLLYLDNIGTKTKGYVYLDSRVKGVFECLNTTSITANETVNFLNISNKSNSDKLENLFTFEAYKRLDNSTTITLKSSFNIAIITFNEGASNISRSLTLVLKKGIMQEFNCISGSSLQGYLKFSYDGDRTISGFRNVTSESLSKDVLVVYF